MLLTRLIVGVIGGTFFGAFAAEVLSRNKKGVLATALDRAKLAAEDFSQAFARGYRGELPSDRERPSV